MYKCSSGCVCRWQHLTFVSGLTLHRKVIFWLVCCPVSFRDLPVSASSGLGWLSHESWGPDFSFSRLCDKCYADWAIFPSAFKKQMLWGCVVVSWEADTDKSMWVWGWSTQQLQNSQGYIEKTRSQRQKQKHNKKWMLWSWASPALNSVFLWVHGWSQ